MGRGSVLERRFETWASSLTPHCLCLLDGMKYYKPLVRSMMFLCQESKIAQTGDTCVTTFLPREGQLYNHSCVAQQWAVWNTSQRTKNITYARFYSCKTLTKFPDEGVDAAVVAKLLSRFAEAEQDVGVRVCRLQLVVEEATTGCRWSRRDLIVVEQTRVPASSLYSCRKQTVDAG